MVGIGLQARFSLGLVRAVFPHADVMRGTERGNIEGVTIMRESMAPSTWRRSCLRVQVVDLQCVSSGGVRGTLRLKCGRNDVQGQATNLGPYLVPSKGFRRI